jgi:glycerol-3-phosphate dehydrogenase
VEKGDFSSATSSRSTKLVHGGVRYLEQAVKQFDRGLLNLVTDALRERTTLMANAPHLSRPMPLFTPLYRSWEIPYYLMGLKIYDWLAGRRSNMPGARYVSAKEAKQLFPNIKTEGLKGGVLYYDGQFDDARMNVSLALSAREQGATVANYVEVQDLVKVDGKVQGVRLKDAQTGETFDAKAKVVINATGPFGDGLRKLDDPAATPLLSTSSGTHIVLDGNFSPSDRGMLIPKTEDGRVLFVLPWNGKTIVGTTDNPAALSEHPRATDDDVKFILRQLSGYLKTPVTERDVLSRWSGLRPLVSNPGVAGGTAQLSRDHVIVVSDSGLVTIMGGKWTTYRKMAEDAVDRAVQTGRLTPRNPTRTANLPVMGGALYRPGLGKEIATAYGLPTDVADHLAKSYGDRAVHLAELAKAGHNARLDPAHPFIEAEVLYGIRTEGALTPVDILARRTRMSFLDQTAALRALPRVAEIMGAELGWNATRLADEIRQATEYLK